MKRSLSIVISILIFVVGCGVMFYPTISNWLYEQNASYAISGYIEQVGTKSNEDYLAEFAAARAYNASLSGDVQSFMEAEMDGDVQNPDYWETFDQIDGIMGVIEIPAVNVTLPIYHGTDESVLQKGAGHLEGSALPTGDAGNHTVITGHTGLPTAMLFTDLDELVLGDRFYLEILDQTFVYEIQNIYVVLPSDTEQLKVQPGKDLVTLVTCTPYGINSHRLLIQGHRVDEEPPTTLVNTPHIEAEQAPAGTNALDNLPTLVVVASVMGVLLLIAIVIFLLGGHHSPEKRAKRKAAKMAKKLKRLQRK